MIEKIISGGQTGIDRAALDFAIDAGIEHGGWVPRGRKAEDGEVPARYRMKEHHSSEYPGRTEANVLEADATVIFVIGTLNSEPGCLLTAKLCREAGKPFMVINLSKEDERRSLNQLAAFLGQGITVLNVAGTRGSRISRAETTMMKRILAGAVAVVAKGA